MNNLPAPLLQRFLETMPQNSWGVAAYQIDSRDNPTFAYRFAAAAIQESMARVGEGIQGQRGSYCSLGNIILASFADGNPRSTDEAMKLMNATRFSNLDGAPGLDTVTGGLGPFVHILSAFTAGLGGPAALLPGLQGMSFAPAMESLNPLHSVVELPGASQVQDMLSRPLSTKDLIGEPRSRAFGKTPMQRDRDEVEALFEQFIEERKHPERPWSSSLRDQIAQVEGDLERQIETAPNKRTRDRLQKMYTFVEAIDAVVQEPRQIASLGRYSGTMHHTFIPGFADKMLVQEAAFDSYTVHDPANFENPAELDGQNVDVLYNESGTVAAVDKNPIIERRRERGMEF